MIQPHNGISLSYNDRRNEVLIHVTIWMSLENIILSERRQTQKGCILYDSIYMVWPEKENPERQTLVAPRYWGHGKQGATGNTVGFSIWGDENILELNSGDDAQLSECTKKENHLILYKYILTGEYYGLWIIS